MTNQCALSGHNIHAAPFFFLATEPPCISPSLSFKTDGGCSAYMCVSMGVWTCLHRFPYTQTQMHNLHTYCHLPVVSSIDLSSLAQFCWQQCISITQASLIYPHLHTCAAATMATTTSQAVTTLHYSWSLGSDTLALIRHLGNPIFVKKDSEAVLFFALLVSNIM